VNESVLVEAKAFPRLQSAPDAQLLNYPRATALEVDSTQFWSPPTIQKACIRKLLEEAFLLYLYLSGTWALSSTRRRNDPFPSASIRGSLIYFTAAEVAGARP
jgi:hypothetical protein